MADRQVYNPYGNNPTGMFIDRFQGVHNDGLGTNLAPSAVDYAQNADDRWRGAVKKRNGYTKHLSKGYPVNSFSNVFDGFFIQGDDDVWYRSEALLDYRVRPGAGGNPSIPPFTLTTFTGYLQSRLSSTPDAFTGSPPFGGGSYVSTGTDTWRFRNIALAIDERRLDLGGTISGLPLETKDANITFLDINNARGFIEAMCGSYYQDKATIDADDHGIQSVSNYTIGTYSDLLQMLNIGGNIGTFEWSNINSGGAIVYRNRMINTDQKTDLMYYELETALLGLRFVFATSASNTYTIASGQLGGIDLTDLPWYMSGTSPNTSAGRMAVRDSVGDRLPNPLLQDAGPVVPPDRTENPVYWVGANTISDSVVTTARMNRSVQIGRLGSCTLYAPATGASATIKIYKHTTKAYTADAKLGSRAR
jgi:hypothetical protein